MFKRIRNLEKDLERYIDSNAWKRRTLQSLVIDNQVAMEGLRNDVDFLQNLVHLLLDKLEVEVKHVEEHYTLVEKEQE